MTEIYEMMVKAQYKELRKQPRIGGGYSTLILVGVGSSLII